MAGSSTTPATTTGTAQAPPATPGITWSSNTTGVKTSAGDPGGNWTAADPNAPGFFFQWNPTQGFSYSNLNTGDSSHSTVGSTPGHFATSLGAAVQDYESLWGNAPAATISSFLQGTTIGSNAATPSTTTAAGGATSTTDPITSLLAALPGLLGNGTDANAGNPQGGSASPTILPTTTSSAGGSAANPTIIIGLLLLAGILGYVWWRKHKHGTHAEAA